MTGAASGLCVLGQLEAVAVFSGRRGDSPKYEQVLLHAEALSPQVPPRLLVEAPRACGSLVRVTVQLGELHQLVLFEGVVVFGLLPHPGPVDDQALLQGTERGM